MSVTFAAVTGGLLLGGSSTFLVNLSRAFPSTGQSLSLLLLSQGNDHVADFAAIPADLHTVPADRIYEDRLSWARRTLGELRPAAVLACLGGSSFEVLRSVPPGVLRLGLIQSDDEVVYQMTRNYAPWMDAMVGVSEQICRNIRTITEFARTPVHYIPYGIHFSPAARLPRRDAALKVVYVGRLIEEQKRVSRIVSLIRNVRRQGLNITFTFIGGGPQENETRAALAGVEGVSFAGEVPNEQIANLLASQDVYLLLSDYEGLPISLLEGMGQGLVPVVSDLPSGIRDVVTGDCGIRVPVGDEAAALEALKRLSASPTLVEHLGAAAAQKIRQEFSASRMAENYAILVRSATAEFKPDWSGPVRIPKPLNVRPRWLYSPVGRVFRRLIKTSKRGNI